MSDKPVILNLARQVGREELVRYYSHSETKTFEDGQILRDHQEAVDFKVQSKITKFDPRKKWIYLEQTTVDKDGIQSLHDLAFPEKNETIDFILTPGAEVAKAGEFPPESIFYVPPISLPQGPVNVGETWAMKRQWISLKTGLPLQIDIATVLKGLYRCGENNTCADLEVSGNVSIPVPEAKRGMRFDSEISGRFLFSVDNGTVVWSHVRTEETYANPEGHSVVASCMISNLLEPKNESSLKLMTTCDPKAKITLPY